MNNCIKCGTSLEAYFIYSGTVKTTGNRKYCDPCYVEVKKQWVQTSIQRAKERDERVKKIKTKPCKRCNKDFMCSSLNRKYCSECKITIDKENSLRSSLKYIRDHKRALGLIHSNIKSGNITIIYECIHSGQKHKHHFDYKMYPLLVLLLCPDCHMKEHKRLRMLSTNFKELQENANADGQ